MHQALAADLLISTYHFSRIMAEGVREGRYRRLGSRKRRGVTYEVTDPVAWTRQREEDAARPQ